MKKLVFVLLLWLFGIRGDTEMETSNPPDTKPFSVTITTNAESSPLTETTTQRTTQTVTSQTSVTLLEQTKPQKIPLNRFLDTSNGVKSENVIILDYKTIFIQDFYFNGNGSNVHFFVGKGYEPSEQGFVISDGTTDSPLRAYNGQNITLRLPGELTTKDINWLAVWSVTDRKNLGFVTVNKKPSPYPPQTLGLQNIVKSNPVVIVNKKTLFIPNLRYDGQHDSVHFWVGNGSGPSDTGHVIPDENGSVENLHSYNGQNVYIRLTDGITTDDIEYFGVWSVVEQLNLGHVILQDLSNVPQSYGYEEKTEDGKIIMRVPKCCSIFSILSTEGCVYNDSVVFQPTFNVFEHNETHFNNDSLNLDEIKFEPYTFSIPCPSGKYPLINEVETYALLQNGSLILKGIGTVGILSQGEFCLENLDDGSNSMQVLICAPTVKINHAMYHAYLSLTIISTLCFAGAFILYYFILRCKDIHKICFMGYSLSMCATFLFLTIAQIALIESNDGCKALGFFFQFSMICSFVWLGILCFDILFIVIYFQENSKAGKRFKWYCAVALLVPTVSVFISLVRNLVPDVPDSFFKPQYGRNTCYFDENDQRRIFFYVPISISVVISAICLAYTKYKIVQTDKNSANNYFWITNGRNYKFMFRQCFFTLVIVTLCWILDVVTSFIDESNGISIAAVIVEALQGVFIVGVFTVHQYGTAYMDKREKNDRKCCSTELRRLNA